MLKFKYKVNREKKSIYWEAQWNGKHDETWYKSDEYTSHPFSATSEFQTDYDLFVRIQEAFKRTKKSVITFDDLRNLDGTLKRKSRAKPKRGQPRMWTSTLKIRRSDLAKFDPSNQRKIGDVVELNPVTRALCKMLSEKERVTKHSGWSDPYWYWMMLLSGLNNLWD